MKAIFMEYDRFQELFDRLTKEIELDKFLVRGRDNSIASYHRHVHYQLHSFMRAVVDGKPWAPSYMVPEVKLPPVPSIEYDDKEKE